MSVVYNNGKAEERSSCLRLYNPDTYEYSCPYDRVLFFSIQFSIYLENKKKGIKSPAEKDMLEDLLTVYWEEIESSGILDGKTIEEKLIICHEFKVYFPYTEIPAYLT